MPRPLKDRPTSRVPAWLAQARFWTRREIRSARGASEDVMSDHRPRSRPADGGGLPEAIGRAGLIFRRNNMDSLVNCIHRVLESPALERLLRDAAPMHLSAHLPHIVAKKYLQVIGEAFSGGNKLIRMNYEVSQQSEPSDPSGF